MIKVHTRENLLRLLVGSWFVCSLFCKAAIPKVFRNKCLFTDSSYPIKPQSVFPSLFVSDSQELGVLNYHFSFMFFISTLIFTAPH